MSKKAWGLVALAVLAEAAAHGLVVTAPDGRWAVLGCVVHVVAAVASWRAAFGRRPDLSRVESDLVLYTALLVPGYRSHFIGAGN